MIDQEKINFRTLGGLSSLRKPLKWAACAGILALGVFTFVPNYYRSEARLLPVEARGGGNLGQLAAAAAAFGVNIPGNTDDDANLVDILQSRWLGERLLNSTFHYHLRRWRFGKDSTIDGTLYGYINKRNTDRALKKLEDILKINRDLKSKVITIRVETKSADLSQQIVERADVLLEEFIQEKTQTRGGAKANFADERLRDAKARREKSENEFRDFLEHNRNYQLSIDPSIRLRGARLESDLRLQEQIVTNLAIAREQAILESKDDIPILNILDSGNLPCEKSWPPRGIISIIVALLTLVIGWTWINRDWVRTHLLTGRIT